MMVLIPGCNQRWNQMSISCVRMKSGQLSRSIQASAHTPLLRASTHDEGRPTESWFGWARNLIFRCFGCG
ncbi:unnamed protein product [Calypogeia fissa]